MHALEVKNFSKIYTDKKKGTEVRAVDDISFSIPQGEFFGFLGPNGAGKTTTISCITGVGHFTLGEIKVFGIDVNKDYRKARWKVGVSPQEVNVDFFAPADKIVWNMAGYYGMSTVDRKKRMNELFDILELHEHKKKQFRQLSGGLKRRVMLARAMVHDPDFLILDEPSAGVDVELRHEMWKYLKKINNEGKTILFTSHYLEEVEELCDRIAIIDKGKIIVDKKKSDLLSDGNSLEKTYLDITKKA